MGRARFTAMASKIFCILVVIAFASIVIGVSSAEESPDDCMNVEEPGYAGGDRQCFGTDELGMVCGWDGEKDSEAYCEKGSRGLMVNARNRTATPRSPIRSTMWNRAKESPRIHKVIDQ